MQERTWTNIDRPNWPHGPWDNEPDKVQFLDVETGLPCLAVRNPEMGHWCGYVGVPPTHPLHGKKYDDVDLRVHWGVNFAAGCDDEQGEGRGICHTPDPGEPDNVWWFGFDCAHGGDLVPTMVGLFRFKSRADLQYRTLEYVKAECRGLAKQLSAAS